MEGVVRHEDVLVHSLPLMLPMAAQRLYVDAYKQSMARPMEGAPDELAREKVASRDAWAAVRCEYKEDLATLKWSRIVDPATGKEAPTAKHSVLGKIRGMFRFI